MREIRILFTGTGRRVELLQAFRAAALCLKVNLKIYGADMAGSAPALAYCDYSRKICAMKDKNYIEELIEICRSDKVDLLIPTIDTDLLELSHNKHRFEEIGTKVMISSPEMIAICRDKNYTSDFFEKCGLKAPLPVNDYKLYKGDFPCFIKPKDGSSSIDAYKVNTPAELEMYAGKIGDYIIQPFIGGTEYTIDIFCDFDGNPVYVTPRERIAVRSGEVLKTRIELDKTMTAEALKIIDRFKPCGPMTVQLIRQYSTNEDYYIEINPRYGGGAPLSIKAGADSAAAVLKLIMGEKLGYQENAAEDGAVYSRFDQSIRIVSESIKGDGDNAAQGSADFTHNITGVIFDLDDTLYSEKSYVKSGYHAVAEFLYDSINAGGDGEVNEEISSTFKEKSKITSDIILPKEAGLDKITTDMLEKKLWKYFLDGKAAIDELLNEIGCIGMKEECLDLYRNHIPQIKLYEGAFELIKYLKTYGIKLGIITDGRVNGQKNKLKALGLTELVDDIIITDELGGVQFRKPNDIAFRIIQCRWRLPFGQIAYVGDNINKDFQAPKQLGMRCILIDNEDGLYHSAAYEKECDLKVKDLKELGEKLKYINRSKLDMI